MFSALETIEIPHFTTTPTIFELEELIWKAMQAWAKTGGKIKDGSWGYDEKDFSCRCALSSLIPKASNNNLTDEIYNPVHKKTKELFRSKLLLEKNSFDAIVYGFDMSLNEFQVYEKSSYTDEYVQMGQRLRQKAQKLDAWIGSKD